MRVSDLGESAMQLPWLAPGVESLVALARTRLPSVWTQIRQDPGAVLLLARHFPKHQVESFPDAIFRSSAVLESALRCVQANAAGAIDWAHPDVAALHQAALAYARVSELIAQRVGGVDPACAWVGGLLAPLGWMAIAAIEPEAIGDCLRRPADADQLCETQRHIWGLDAEALSRRLARRWELPDWLRAIVGFLSLPAQDAIQIGADERLFRIVQLAVLLAQTNGHHLGLPVGGDCETLLADLGLSEEELNAIGTEWCLFKSLRTDQKTQAAASHSLMPELLALAIENRRLDDGQYGERLESELDRLQQALIEQRRSESERLHKQKLRAMVELAAGAGHEINNPLAVISGQCQYLLRREEDSARRDSLRIVIRQTERIHQILTDLMQFARPGTPQRQPQDLKAVIGDVIARQLPLAEAQTVRLEWREPGFALPVQADLAMVRTAVAALVRNACDAAGANGWVRVSIASADRLWQVVVEDSGSGPAQIQVEHLFDPFYSGRTAGRGRGLGLPTAWRLAEENGGTVRFEPTADSPARFVLSLPRSEPAVEPFPRTDEYFDRKSA